MPKRKSKKKNWRTACRQAMRAATRREAKSRFGTPNPLFNYRWEHVQAVVNVSLKLAKITGADPEIVEAAAWLHDIKKLSAKQKHPIAGAVYAREYLKKTDFPKKKIERVARAIEQHMGLWTARKVKGLEAQVLWDADKLTKIGLTGSIHISAYMLIKNKEPVTTEKLIDEMLSQDWVEKTVASMHTKPAQKAARKRLKAQQKLWERLRAEFNAEDI